MTALTWVQPADLLTHELVASQADGKPVDDVRRRWVAAGGSPEPPVGGLGPEVDPALRDLAVGLLDELDARPADPALLAREPDDLAAIRALWRDVPRHEPADDLADRVHGAWAGRAAGCLLGKPVEKIPREGIREILTSQGRWPLTTWFTAVGLPDDVARRWPWNRSAAVSLAEHLQGMPEDDDLNFAMLALSLVEQHADALTTDDVATAWLRNLPAARVFTAERVAYRNLLLGDPADLARQRHNPFREWIGAMIRTDAYGWAHPGDPAAAVPLAWTDARLSHVRSGLYGALFAAAMTSWSLVADGPDAVDEVVAAGLAVVPPESRLADAVRFGVLLGRSGRPVEECLDELHRRYGTLHWVHTLNNTALTAYALVAGRGCFDACVPVAVMAGWDTDSVGATVGSVCGGLAGLSGLSGLPGRWVEPLANRVASSLPGFDGIGLDRLAARTLAVVRAGAGA